MNAARKRCTVFRTVINARDGVRRSKRWSANRNGVRWSNYVRSARRCTKHDEYDRQTRQRTYVDARRSFTSRSMHQLFLCSVGNSVYNIKRIINAFLIHRSFSNWSFRVAMACTETATLVVLEEETARTPRVLHNYSASPHSWQNRSRIVRETTSTSYIMRPLLNP